MHHPTTFCGRLNRFNGIQMAAVRHLGSVCVTCQISWWSAQILWFLIFQNGPRVSSWIFCERLDHPRKVFDGVYHCAKFGWNWCSNFDKMQVLMCSNLSLNAYSCPQNGGFGGFYSHSSGQQYQRDPQKTAPCTERRPITYGLSKSAHICVAWWLSGRALNLRFIGRGFNSRPVAFT